MNSSAFDSIKADNKNVRILIVDDMTDNIEVATSMLAPEGFTLLFAQSGEECLNIARKEQPDIILLDIMMPEMDGIETCRRLKEDVATSHISVIFLTAKTDDETLSGSFEAGGYDYISKPFSSAVLLCRVYNQLRLIYKQEALTKTQERLAKIEKSQLLGLLAGGIAHDFNNQLNGIMGFSDLIKDRTSDEKVIRLADLITECGERCAVLTNNLLAFAGKGKYQITAVNISELIDSANNEIISKYPNIRMLLKAESDSPVVLGDYSQIASVINTVVVNAVEAIGKNTDGVITFELLDCDAECLSELRGTDSSEQTVYLKIMISDTGVGIPGEDVDRVFEPFFTTKDLCDGGGMSLAAAYGIVENHGGEIYLSSNEGEGTTVTILLPKEVSRDSENLSKNIASERPDDQSYVLVIDDNKMSRILLEDIVSAQDYRVLAAANGIDGLELFNKYKDKIRFVFLDYVMPQMTGEEVLQKMLEIDSEAVVYMISGFKSEESIRGVIDMGAKGFIKKPFKCREILDIL